MMYTIHAARNKETGEWFQYYVTCDSRCQPSLPIVELPEPWEDKRYTGGGIAGHFPNLREECPDNMKLTYDQILHNVEVVTILDENIIKQAKLQQAATELS